MTKLNVSYVAHSNAQNVIARISVFTTDLRTTKIFFDHNLCFDEEDNNTREISLRRNSLAEARKRVSEIVELLTEHLKKYRTLQKLCEASDQTDVEL